MHMCYHFCTNETILGTDIGYLYQVLILDTYIRGVHLRGIECLK